MRILNLSLTCLGYVCSLAGFIGLIAAAISLLDPAGIQMANDHDPFGDPPATFEVLLLGAGSAAILGLGGWLVFRKPAHRRKP